MSTTTVQVPQLSGSNASRALWERAYQDLCEEDKEVLGKHEEELSKATKILVDEKLREDAINEWTLTIAGKPLKLRELGLNIIGFINSSQAYVQSATSLETHAALAWSCVSLLLPVILNQKGQHDSMLAGLERISHLIDFYMEWEKIYLDDQKIDFEETVVKLYGAILSYQARLLEYLPKNAVTKFGRNIVKVDTWDDWLAEVNKWDENCKRFTALADAEKEDERWNRQQMQLSQQYNMSEKILAALEDIGQQKLQRLSEVQESKRIELLRSLSSDYKRQKDSNPQRVPGTCDWFVKDQRFSEWRDSTEARLLHCYADPGSGKSVLAKCLIDERLVVSSESVSVLYFFFKDGQEAQQHCANAMAAMLHQLYTEPSQQGMAVHAIPKFGAYGTKLSMMFDELWEIFEMILNDPAAGEIVCVIDALDECTREDRDRLMQKITRYFSDPGALELAGGRLKVLITSRPYGEIDDHYWPLNDNSAVVRLDGSDQAPLIMAEINLVINVKVPLLFPKVSKLVQQTIIEHLQGIENRTYLWLHLMLDYIRSHIAGHGTEKGINNLMEKLPPDINKAYRSMLSKCTDPEQGKALLCFVIAAKRPLSVSEIQVALRLTLGSYESFEDIDDDLETDEQFKDSLKELCGLLLSVHDGQVYLIHLTAREYLTQTNFSLGDGESQWQGPINPILAESTMSKACISILCLRNFRAQPPWASSFMKVSEIEERVGQWIDKYTFLRYAAEYWVEHFRASQDPLDANLLKDAVSICRVKSGYFCTWYPVLCGRLQVNVLLDHADLIFPSLSGLFSLVKVFLDEGAELDAEDGHYGTALQAACHAGYEPVVKLLIERGANVNAQGGHFGNALQAASSKGYESIVQMLLEKGADVRAQNGYYDTALQAASYNGHESVVKMLLEKGADVNAQGGCYGSAVLAASYGGHDTVQKLLIEKGAYFAVKAKDSLFSDALEAASAGGHNALVWELLERGVDVNTHGDYGTALQVASLKGHFYLIEMLLYRGADINAQGGPFGNALQAASFEGHNLVVWLLLENGADINAQGGEYGNALQAASYGGHKSVVQLLLEKGADINAQGGQYGNALQAACTNGDESVIQLLLEKGADIDAQGGYCGNALQAASLQGYKSVVMLLLEKGVDINAQGGRYGNALQAACESGDESLVQLLLAKGADINAQGGRHANALHAASLRGSEPLVRLLLNEGADINAQLEFCGDALHEAISQGREAVVKLLLEKTEPQTILTPGSDEEEEQQEAIDLE